MPNAFCGSRHKEILEGNGAGWAAAGGGGGGGGGGVAPAEFSGEGTKDYPLQISITQTFLASGIILPP